MRSLQVADNRGRMVSGHLKTITREFMINILIKFVKKLLTNTESQSYNRLRARTNLFKDFVSNIHQFFWIKYLQSCIRSRDDYKSNQHEILLTVRYWWTETLTWTHKKDRKLSWYMHNQRHFSWSLFRVQHNNKLQPESIVTMTLFNQWNHNCCLFFMTFNERFFC